MFFDLFELQRRQFEMWLEAGAAASKLTPMQAFMPNVASAQAEIFRRMTSEVGDKLVSLEEAVAIDAAAPLEIKELPSPTAFARICRFTPGRAAKPILFIAPYSGYATSVSSPLIAALGDTIVTDWKSARDVALVHGSFGLDDQARLVARLLGEASEPPIIVGLSQSGPAVLMGSALAIQDDTARPPAGIILLGAPIGRQRPGDPLHMMINTVGHNSLDAFMQQTVQAPHEGRGRLVYPGLMQLFSFLMSNPAAYLETQLGYFQELVSGNLR